MVASVPDKLAHVSRALNPSLNVRHRNAQADQTIFLFEWAWEICNLLASLQLSSRMQMAHSVVAPRKRPMLDDNPRSLAEFTFGLVIISCRLAYRPML